MPFYSPGNIGQCLNTILVLIAIGDNDNLGFKKVASFSNFQCLDYPRATKMLVVEKFRSSYRSFGLQIANMNGLQRRTCLRKRR